EKKKDSFWIGVEDYPQLREFQKFLAEKKASRPDLVFHKYNEIGYFKDYFSDPLQKKIPCVVSAKRLGIDSKGNVYGGCWSMGSFGNIKNSRLKAIIRSSKYNQAHKNMFFKDCPGCSCGYSENLRGYMPYLIKELLLSLSPDPGKKIGG
ncbi:MAG: SPASM domain-containing protein, partial [Candidatus Omnitrophica bacterium]|nr:SPASM domain-containing protein [Candidatus Omnitrophota bacterium]